MTVLDRILPAVLGVSAALTTGAVLYRTFLEPPGEPTPQESPVLLSNWKDRWASTRHLSGSIDAPVVVLVFSDLECPACAGFHSSTQRLLAEFPNQIDIRYVPFPLERHRFARPAARVGECASRIDRLPQWVDVIYSGQDSLGLIAWNDFALRAGIADTLHLSACASDPTIDSIIEAGIDFGVSMGVNSTPTILINGWKMPGVPSYRLLRTAVSSALEGRALDDLEGQANIVVPAAAPR